MAARSGKTPLLRTRPDTGCGHDHGQETTSAGAVLAEAEHRAVALGARLTPQRRAVLEALIEAGGPCGAYDLIERLRARTGRAPAPIVVYRALDFLRELGLIHRLETLNALLACPHRHESAERVVFLICETCRRVEEAVSAPLNDALHALAGACALCRTKN